jgi:starch-binding outer membrane protein, SusD/RagB family
LCWLQHCFYGSCEKFLTEDLKGTFSTDTFYKNEKQAIQAINGVYQAISFKDPDNNIWVFGDVASDDAVKGGKSRRPGRNQLYR